MHWIWLVIFPVLAGKVRARQSFKWDEVGEGCIRTVILPVFYNVQFFSRYILIGMQWWIMYMQGFKIFWQWTLSHVKCNLMQCCVSRNLWVHDIPSGIITLLQPIDRFQYPFRYWGPRSHRMPFSQYMITFHVGHSIVTLLLLCSGCVFALSLEEWVNHRYIPTEKSNKLFTCEAFCKKVVS